MTLTSPRKSITLFLSGLAAALALVPAGRGRFAPAPVHTNRFTNSIGMKFVRIAPGKFLMGRAASEKGRIDEDQHAVQITRPFYLGVHEVTQAQYEEVLGSNPSNYAAGGDGRNLVRGLDTGKFPVERVSWEDAQEFCRKLAALPGERAAGRVYRLPTEAEWEYACRAGAKEYATYFFGNTITTAQANFGGVFRRPTDVGCYKPNAWGLCDMHGNVWEWVADWYSKDYYKTSPKADPPGPKTGGSRVLRGGAYFNDASYLRSAIRAYHPPQTRAPHVGFRIACAAGKSK
jgi:formylglycine-generating enzyme required for sulfatase activity